MAVPLYRYRLVSPDLLRRLMERTGTGSRISIRDLAAAAGVSHGTIHALVQGETRTAAPQVAHEVCRVIGVDLLILFTPTGRAVPADESDALCAGAAA
ncbi:helix-turn-helix transcriptional regulator [Streptomyces sp. ODS28]|uniref:helix-turn-helix domain-containing protein n=1 Tax=Streptomyces sp. ODS28 TaxID=3136688 RepID=UPI0031EBF2FD